jgi:predicted dehydrogenase
MTDEPIPSESASSRRETAPGGIVRYAVVGLGHIAQAAVLPGFRNAKSNSKIAALVSGDPEKLKQLRKKYKAKTYSYEQYDECLASGEIDAVYIALPNHLHCEYTVRAAEAGIHVLCEKPMAVTAEECEKMIHAASDVKIMIAYRLHLEEANLKAIEIAQSGQLGELRIFNSVFCMQVKEGDVRVMPNDVGGGTIYDIGVYCINAARYLFRAEPTEVFATLASKDGDPRFAESEEMASVVMRFPGNRLATFTCSFGAASHSSYNIVGTKADLRAEPAYDYAVKLTHYLTENDKTTKTVFAKRDHFGAELVYFSDCILNDRQPEPNGNEGLIDVRIVQALYKSAKTGRPVQLQAEVPQGRPTMDQEVQLPATSEPDLVNTQPPHS